ncbi:MAG: uncharacterized protein JWO37_1783 [Acidimicrobiales bacterium]|jgi:hypothetical protein|nr:uncharacterized protein [Acidimicrobiales bacterium]
MAAAATAVLGSLEADQLDVMAKAFPSDDERRLWFYSPTDHGGMALCDLRPAQQRLALKLVATGLSRAGYVTVTTIMGVENVLDELEGFTESWGHERARDPARYYLRIFGDPGAEANWAWRFGGHHVSINYTVIDGRLSAMTPCFLGVTPASSPLLGPHPLRPLAGAEDLGRELVRSLDADQRARVVLSPVAPMDIVGANRPRVGEGDLPLPLADLWRSPFGGALDQRLRTIDAEAERAAGLSAGHLEALRLSLAPKGLRASALGSGQQELLRALLDVYVRRMPDAVADEEAAKYRGEHLDKLTFAWAGGMEPGEGHYYRVQGPRMLVEYDNTHRGANHVHTVWRDPDGDFGEDALLSHHITSHGGAPH